MRKTRVEHDARLKRVLKKFRSNNLKINKEKIQFGLGEVELLGVKINGREQTPNDIKKNEALLYPIPKNIKELRRFLGLAGWFRPFVENFARLTIKLTESLKQENKNWRWNDSLNNEFEELKKALRRMSATRLPNYNEDFILKTDASNSGLGAVLMQDVKGKLLPIQWASKKLTPTESRYGISEKEMLAIYWGIKKFEYELRGRKFKLITDHKSLENIRNNPNFNNNRINRWIEKIQEFDFNIEYQKPDNLVGADALSRIHEIEKPIIDKNPEDLKKIQGKISKHVLKEDGKEFWVSDSGLKREYPETRLRKNIVESAHINVNHRGVEATYYNLKEIYYWIGMKQTVVNVIKKCEVCRRINRKNKGGHDFIETTRQLEKVALDLVDLESDNKYALVGIDYYTRFILGQIVEDKKAETILKVVKRWCENYKPEEFITDNGKEFSNVLFKKYCVEQNIKHRKVAVESHVSNGRIERVIRTIREGLLKTTGSDINEKLSSVIQKYNNTFHKGIGRTPIEAICEDNADLMAENSRFGSYAKAFGKRKREKFRIGQKVLITKKENVGAAAKSKIGRFLDKGEIVAIFENDSYLVKKDDGKILKKRHFDLKDNEFVV